ncbi:hypothetical protein D9M71_470200 [compost metagenome]
MLIQVFKRGALEANGTLAAEQTQDRQAEGGFARAAFANDSQGLPLRQAEVDAVHRLDVIDGAPQQAFFDREPDAQVFDLQHRLACRVAGRTAAGLGAEQHLRVRVLRAVEQSLAVGLFDDAAALHHAHPVSNALDQVEVMTDEQQGHPQARLQRLEQFENLQLHGDVQRRGRLVGNQQLRLVGQGHGNHYPLPLAA